MKSQYFWLHFAHPSDPAHEWVIFEKSGNRYFGWGSYWNADYFDRVVGPLKAPVASKPQPPPNDPELHELYGMMGKHAN